MRSAVLSEDGLYRFRLDRWWGDGPRVAWIMLNPSTADADVDDPTIRRCIGFTKAWGYDGLTVVNRWPLRATHPDDLLPWFDQIGPTVRSTGLPAWSKHLDTIGEVVRGAPLVVAAWGSWVSLSRRTRTDVANVPSFWTTAYGCRLHVLGLTKDGHPRHPLYVRGDVQPQLWPAGIGVAS